MKDHPDSLKRARKRRRSWICPQEAPVSEAQLLTGATSLTTPPVACGSCSQLVWSRATRADAVTDKLSHSGQDLIRQQQEALRGRLQHQRGTRGLEGWEEIPAAPTWAAFLGTCSCSCSWWPFFWPPRLRQVSDCPPQQRTSPIPLWHSPAQMLNSGTSWPCGLFIPHPICQPRSKVGKSEAG